MLLHFILVFLFVKYPKSKNFKLDHLLCLLGLAAALDILQKKFLKI